MIIILFWMNQPINEMVSRGDSEAIQKYVRMHLPSDQVGLERIYK